MARKYSSQQINNDPLKIGDQGKVTQVDLRIKVQNPTEHPYSGIGRVVCYFKDPRVSDIIETYGTGIILSKNIVLTSAHLLYNKKIQAKASQVYFHPELNTRNKVVIKVQKYFMHHDFLNKSSKQSDKYDIALLFLQDNSSISTEQIIHIDWQFNRQKWSNKIYKYNIVGYPSDKHKKINLNCDEQMIYEQYYEQNSIQEYIQPFLHYLHTTSQGNSGGPILIKQQKLAKDQIMQQKKLPQYEYKLIGIHKGFNAKYNYGINLLSPKCLQHIFNSLLQCISQQKQQKNWQHLLQIQKITKKLSQSEDSILQYQKNMQVHNQQFQRLRDQIQKVNLKNNKLQKNINQLQKELKLKQMENTFIINNIKKLSKMENSLIESYLKYQRKQWNASMSPKKTFNLSPKNSQTSSKKSFFSSQKSQQSPQKQSKNSKNKQEFQKKREKFSNSLQQKQIKNDQQIIEYQFVFSDEYPETRKNQIDKKDPQLKLSKIIKENGFEQNQQEQYKKHERPTVISDNIITHPTNRFNFQTQRPNKNFISRTHQEIVTRESMVAQYSNSSIFLQQDYNKISDYSSNKQPQSPSRKNNYPRSNASVPYKLVLKYQKTLKMISNQRLLVLDKRKGYLGYSHDCKLDLQRIRNIKSQQIEKQLNLRSKIQLDDMIEFNCKTKGQQMVIKWKNSQDKQGEWYMRFIDENLAKQWQNVINIVFKDFFIFK